MSDNTHIEWTDATWNPTTGCDKVSDGCKNCYAIRTAHRMASNPNPAIYRAYEGTTEQSGLTPANWTGVVRCLPERLHIPLDWKKPRRVFVNSQSDLFHENVPGTFIEQVFAVMAMCPQHTFQILTKRPERMAEWVNGTTHEQCAAEMALHGPDFLEGKRRSPRLMNQIVRGWTWPLSNVWLGVSVEDQKAADERIPWLLKTPAAVRFISAEPLLGPVAVDQYLPCLEETGEYLPTGDARCEWTTGISWLIVGGESGPKARPMHPDWARELRDQCAAAGVPYFFKQWGEWGPVEYGGPDVTDDGMPCVVWPAVDHHQPCSYCYAYQNAYAGGPPCSGRYGKRAAGRLLDGIEHNAFPEVTP